VAWSGSVEEQREEFLREFLTEGANKSAVCQAWGVSRKTAYKWQARQEREGQAGLKDRSRAPQQRPKQTPAEMEQAVLALREQHPSWGGRKIAVTLQREGKESIPAPSTITAILRRHGKIEPEASQKRKALGRFERERPNELWQMDFKGHFGLGCGLRCHPLVVLDDHSRFLLQLRSCTNEQGKTVQAGLIPTFRRYGLPEQMLMDNGSPWGNDAVHVYTPLVVWLLRLEIGVLHGRPRHPQTQGKLERLNRTLEADVLQGSDFFDAEAAQQGFDPYRVLYNEQRPHEALDMQVPASRYQPSQRGYPEMLPRIEYEAADVVRKVQKGGCMSYGGREYRLPKAFCGEPVALRPTEVEGQVAVYFCKQRIAILDLKGGTTRPVRH
jgi:transposase InsO family protein